MKGIPFLILSAALLIMFTGCKMSGNSAASVQPESTATAVISQESVSPQRAENSAPVKTPDVSEQEGNIFNDDGSVKIDVYVNDQLMDVKVLDDDPPPVDGPNNLGNYTLAGPIMDFLGIEYTINESGNKINLKSEKYGEMDFNYDSDVKVADEEIYLQFYDFRVYTNGSLKQDDYNSMYLYTGDYERTDIPATLEECYAMLDETLSPEDKEYMKNISEKDFALQYQMGLGLWMRNNWLYPTQSKLTKLLFDNGIDNIDSMSSLIMGGYVKYLKGEPCLLEDLLE